MIDKRFIGVEEVTVSIGSEDLDILCNTGKYSIEHNFEEYLPLKCVEEIKLIRNTFGDNAKLILAYLVGLCEDNCGEDDKINTIPFGNLDITAKVTDEGVFVHWSKEVK